MFGNSGKEFSNGEDGPSYKKKIYSEEKGKKRKRKIYKSQSATPIFSESIFSEFQRQQTLEINSFNHSRQVFFEAIDLRQRNISVSQISAAELTIRLRIIRYLYEKHSGAEFSHTVRDIYEAIIDHFNDSDSDNIESYIYRFSSSKSFESSFIGSISDILNTSDSCDLFRLTTRTFLSSSEPQRSSESKSCSNKVSTR